MNTLYNQLCTYVYTRQFSCNPNPSTLEPDRPQHDCPAACVIAQQYSSSTYSRTVLLFSPSSILPPLTVSLCSCYRKGDFSPRLKTVLLFQFLNPLKPELNPICYLLALLGVHHFLHISRIRVTSLTFRLLMSYIYGAPIFDVSRSHTTTQHSR